MIGWCFLKSIVSFVVAAVLYPVPSFSLEALTTGMMLAEDWWWWLCCYIMVLVKFRHLAVDVLLMLWAVGNLLDFWFLTNELTKRSNDWSALEFSTFLGCSLVKLYFIFRYKSKFLWAKESDAWIQPGFGGAFVLNKAGFFVIADYGLLGTTELMRLVGGVARSALTERVVGYCNAKGDLAWCDVPVA